MAKTYEPADHEAIHPHNFKDLTGREFGSLVVLGFVRREDRLSRWRVRCTCGTETVVRGCHLVSGRTASCGCKRLRNRKGPVRHGQHRSITYAAWLSMKQRCGARDPNSKIYRHYAAKGIKVCDRWSHSFEAFFADVGVRPSKAHTLDRIDNARGYEPGNCRWATIQEQNRNRTSNRLIEWNGETLCIAEWSERTGISESAIWHRLNTGWSTQDALSRPVRVLTKRA